VRFVLAAHGDQPSHDKWVSFAMDYDAGFPQDYDTCVSFQMNGAYESEVTKLFGAVLREGDFCVDGGAGVGYYTLLASKLVGGLNGALGRVESFEPHFRNFQKVQANIKLNKLTNVNVVNRPLWDRNYQNLTLHSGVHTGLSSLEPCADEVFKASCKSLTLDSWCIAGQHCRLLKLDIEGAELHALKGAEWMLREGVDFICCEINEPALARFHTNQMELRDYMVSFGYSTFLLQPNGSKPQLLERSTPVTCVVLNTNVLFSKQQQVDEAWP